ncbi:MAG TPA: hypothetical protein VHV51_20920 [Polyangiaceae bacterium]|jgi:hypothetical protein|nr:hypothetical protein [Polyangiaceae bacterium]
MQTLIDSRLQEEAKRFALRFTCEHCVHFESDSRACANGYPVSAHLEIDLEVSTRLEFCKEFELA